MPTPKFTKKIISDYFRTDCQRFLALSLYRTNKKSEQPMYDMPTPIVARKSQQSLAKPGKDAEEIIYKLLSDEFGSLVINYKEKKNENLENTLRNGLDNILFLCEAEITTNELIEDFFSELDIDTSSFKDKIDMSDMRPDIIMKIEDESKTYYEVLGDGNLKEISKDDARTKLGVIDIKYTEQSNSGYDAEIVLYSMIFSLWLKKKNLDKEYVVVSEAGILTGALQVNAFTGDCEKLEGETTDEKYTSLLKYVSFVEFDQLAITLRKVLQNDIVKILSSPESWEGLDWHVGQKCGMCDWLAFEEWLGEEDKKLITEKHCYLNSDKNDTLCKIPFVSKGMSGVFKDSNITTVRNVASTNGQEAVYSEHTGLKKNSSILHKRAKALTSETELEERQILSMPSYSSTSICITVNFDPSTGVTSSIGIYAYWREYSEYGDGEEYRKVKKWHEQFFTETPTPQEEFNMLGRFLAKLSDIFIYANSKENNTHPNYDPTKVKTSQNYQMYFWDQSQFEQLQKAIGHHIGTILDDHNMKALIWLFSPEETLEDPFKITSQPITFIKEVLRQNVALSVPYEYTIFNVAKKYLEDPTSFNFISKAFYDPFSDTIPKDRLYEIWGKTSRPNYQEVRTKYTEITKKQVLALYLIANKIRADLKPYLKGEATQLKLSVFNDLKNIKRLPDDSQLWYLYDLLNEKYNTLESNIIASTPANELEASYKVIVMQERLSSKEKEKILKEYFPDINAIGIEVYKVTEDSKNTKIKDNESWLSIGYKNQEGLPNRTLSSLLREKNIDNEKYKDKLYSKMDKILVADIKVFDRVNGYIVIEFQNKALIKKLVEDRVININHDLCLMKLGSFPSSKNVLEYLKQIKNPPIVCIEESSLKSLGINTPKKAGKDKVYPISKLLWQADSLHDSDSKIATADASDSLSFVNNLLEENLNKSQEEAILKSLTKQLNIIWGPPGTGKTKTASILIASRIEYSIKREKTFRILLTAPTYQACIELYERTMPYIKKKQEITTYALQSSKRVDFTNLKEQMKQSNSKFILFQGNSEKNNSDFSLDQLRQDIQNNALEKITIILAPVAALNGFYKGSPDKKFSGIGEYFDHVILDEASQVDVASSLGVMYGLTDTAQFTLLGDHLQMPPIHKSPAPVGIKFMVGSILEYFRERFDVKPSALNINYRSSKKIVDFIKTLGYEDLKAHNDHVKIEYLDTPRKDNIFNREIENEDFFKTLLDPRKETIAVTYEDGRNSQVNEFEATIVAGTILEAYNSYKGSDDDYNKWFWEQAVGIVTPHKAQKAAVARKLYDKFPKEDYALINEAIDTVEKFQGGQRKLILVSFGVGDPDIIAQEEEFLLNLNRTNVAISRAESKIIVFISENLIHHLPNDKEIIKTAKAIKSFTHQYCNLKEDFTIQYKQKQKDLFVRYR